MVKIGLQITAQLENLTDLTASGDDFRWYLKLKCLHCGTETPEFVYLSLLVANAIQSLLSRHIDTSAGGESLPLAEIESQPLKGGRGSASLVIKCKLCNRENSIDIIKESMKAYTADDMPKFKTIAAFDCRGVEPTDFDPRIGWTARGAETETRFNEVDLSQREWADYDEKAKESVGVYELKHQFIRV